MQSKIYSVPNPMWLSDTFVFQQRDKELGTVYVKLNHENKIEEVGFDIEKRMHNRPLELILSGKSCQEANELQKTILNSFGDEYWYGKRNDLKRQQHQFHMRSVEQGRREMINNACDFLESVEIEIYFNANRDKPDFDYERFVNDFRQAMQESLFLPA